MKIFEKIAIKTEHVENSLLIKGNHFHFEQFPTKEDVEELTEFCKEQNIFNDFSPITGERYSHKFGGNDVSGRKLVFALTKLEMNGKKLYSIADGEFGIRQTATVQDIAEISIPTIKTTIKQHIPNSKAEPS
jgi:hypothetical protein